MRLIKSENAQKTDAVKKNNCEWTKGEKQNHSITAGAGKLLFHFIWWTNKKREIPKGGKTESGEKPETDNLVRQKN